MKRKRRKKERKMKNKDYYHDTDMRTLCDWALRMKEIKTEKEFPAWLEAEYRHLPHLSEEEFLFLSVLIKTYPELKEEGQLVKGPDNIVYIAGSNWFRTKFPLRGNFKLEDFFIDINYNINVLLRDAEELYGYKFEYHGR
jgi:hypothetical protein